MEKNTSSGKAFERACSLHYLTSLNSDISIMIQSMGGYSLPQGYDIEIRAKNSLIQVGKISPRPPMPIYLDIQPSTPLVVPPLNSILATPCQEVATIGPSSKLQELRDGQKMMESLVQNLTNELVNIKKGDY